MKWYLKVLNQYADFSGRARRKEYWMFGLFNIVFALLCIGLDYLLVTTFNDYSFIFIFSVCYCLFVLIPSLAVAVRRLHDIGMSGAWILILLIPYIGAIFLSILLPFINSQPGTNQWGKNPKGIKAILYDNDVEQK